MKIKKILTFLLLFTMALAAAPFCRVVPASAASEKIRVAFFRFSGYHIKDETTGKLSGYGYEFLQLLSRYVDWEYEYFGYDEVNEDGNSISHSDCLDLLEQGKLDLVTSSSKTPEREEKFLFSEKDIGTASTIFTVRTDNDNIVKGDYSTYRGLTVGMIEGNSKNEVFEEFAEENGFTFLPKYYAGEEELTAALLETKEVDGIVSGSLRALGNEKLIESLSPQPFYAVVNKDRTDLMEQLNAAIDELDLQEPDWRNVLKNKYYSTDKSGNIIITAEERDYLASLSESGQKLRVLMNPDRKPYSYFEGGEARGIFPALFEKMTESIKLPQKETTGLPFEYVYARDRAEYYALRASGTIDIVLDFNDDLYLAESSGYKITDPYYTTTHTLVKRRDLKGDPKVFAAQTYADNPFANYLGDFMGKGASSKQYDSLEESVEAVKKGECDATIMLSYAAELYIWSDQRGELISELIGEASSAYTIGVGGKLGGHVLLSILNKCVAGLDRSAASTIVTAEVSRLRPSSDGILAFLRRNPAYIAVIVVGICLFIFAIAMLVVRTLNQRRLERKVEEATGKLKAQTEDLSRALHAADAANRSKTTFLNNMSHDIRTPMNAIIGFTALATTHLDNRERALDYLSKISQASNHLLSLINDVLDMSRIEAGKVHIEERPENLADILQGLRNIIQSDIHAKQLELFIDTVDVTKEEEVYCDKLRLNQILLNLTSNAIKFTKSGGSVFVKVTQKPCAREGYGTYEFSVSDTGIGMSPEFVKTVFDPFTREHNSTVSGIQGTGLGMAITKNIVDIMGGTITVTSEQGKGTEFVVTLELKFTDAEPEHLSLQELNGLYALVVDDDLISCQSVSKMLRQIGMHAEWTVTGREAIVRTQEAIELGHPFEVYIVDWSMPDMDGITTVRRIRSIIGDDSPIILMSAYDWADIEQDARRAGVTGFLSKPLFASDLHRALERSLGKTAPAPEPVQKPNKFAGKRILLAEDNELNREIAEEILTEAGFTVESAENGKIACEMVERSAAGYYDLILMDVQMPIMNGYEAARHIRALEAKELAGIPIIAMTANAFEEDKANAYAAGMNGHLAKPINIETMLNLLEKFLSSTP